MNLRKSALISGVSEAEFWKMTIGEVVRACEAYEDRRRDTAYFAYTTAMTVGLFVGSMFGSKSPPTIEEVYPELFSDKKEEVEKAEQMAKDERSAANFIKFANSFNQRYKPNGDGKPESKNNG